jgi:hypothetical protein
LLRLQRMAGNWTRGKWYEVRGKRRDDVPA